MVAVGRDVDMLGLLPMPMDMVNRGLSSIGSAATALIGKAMLVSNEAQSIFVRKESSHKAS